MGGSPITWLKLRRSEYDVYSRETLREELEGLRAGPSIIDFSNVLYIDSTSLGALIRRLKQLREVDAATRFTLTNVKPQIANVFKITSLDAVFEIPDGDAL